MTYFWPLLMCVALLAGIFTGYPVAFVLAGIGVAVAVLADVPMLFLSTGVSRIFSGVLSNWLLIAVPLFVFMGLMLEKSGIAQRLLRSLAGILGPLPGGYAFAVTIIGIVMAASTGIIGASVVLMGVLALPIMLESRYDPRLATGVIAATGTLGILIPPSIMLVILGDTMRISVGDLFAGALFPGLLLGGLYIAYLIVLAIFRPQVMPPLPKSEHIDVSAALMRLCRDLLAPLLLIIAVLGSIIAGVATPTEAAALGALGAFLLALFSRQLAFRQFVDVIRDTTKTTAMIMFVMVGATIFSVIFRKLGGDVMIEDMLGVSSGEADPYWVMFLIMFFVFILGMFLDWVEITFIVIPIVAPIIAGLDFGMPSEQAMLWFAILFAVNLQTSFLTPPFGYALFYIKGIAPPSVSTRMIYLGIVPFVLLQLLGLLLTVFFPDLVLWLPGKMFGT
ncbi:TRAP transporter large permease [Parapusillimonas granuli]|uniref:TRAP transporter large permease protein n=1 Tax=Parapusillimonas granuli TaxID=380911 RepID=A0A853FPW2_9BURK|nr:TRAP transporter large permease subunit [Parapusillimonas granuli]MBB5216104.1 tripartite ATP-independent transporter DctM subunit [Parapusillimonas granuli]NYT47785.1 TRAP transporter large permease subunit [Parapusillimonas granuli]